MRDTVLNGAEKTAFPNSRLINNAMKNPTKAKTETAIITEKEPDKMKEKTGPKINLNGIGEKVLVELHYWMKYLLTSKQIRSELLEEYNRKPQEKGFLKNEG